MFDTEVVAQILRPTSLPLPVVSVARPQEPQPQSKPESALAEVPVASAAAKSDEPLALRILKEYWGPNTTGSNRYAQRQLTVLFADSSKETLVAEDVVDGWDEPFEDNPFYSDVLSKWRQASQQVPARGLRSPPLESWASHWTGLTRSEPCSRLGDPLN